MLNIFCSNLEQKCRELIDCDYILLLDADMKLEIGKTFNKNCLNGMDYFHILQGNDNFRYKKQLPIFSDN